MVAGIDVNPAHAVAARALVLDAAAVECVSALREAGIRAFLLKGPVTARWLYPDSALRDYVDVDLLVPRTRFQQASLALGRLGFRDTQADRADNEIPAHAHALCVERTGGIQEAARFPAGLCVDLHWTFHGIGASDEDFWALVAEDPERMRISDADLEVPNEPMRALLLALHAATSGAFSGQPLLDVDRGLERVSDETWAAAYDHAVRLDAVPRFLAGLAMRPRGLRLIDRLQLEGRLDVRSALVAQGIPPVAGGVERLMNTPGVGHKARLLMRELIPTRSFMRDWSALARSGPLGLALAYLYRPVWLLAKLPVALRAQARARQAVKAGDLSERRRSVT